MRREMLQSGVLLSRHYVEDATVYRADCALGQLGIIFVYLKRHQIPYIVLS